MDKAVSKPRQPLEGDLCTRCLQPVPYRAARCPGCGQPHNSRRALPLLIGVVGIFALAFVMALMYYAAWRADMMNADVPKDEDGIKQEIMVDTSKNDSKPPEPEKPEKKPPLNEK